MKKTILGLVASTFISGAAIAAPAPVTFTGHASSGAECSAQFDEIGGINVKELSERKQCLAVVHDIDTMFTHKTFWVRTGNTFVAFDVEDLGKMTRSERIETINLDVHKAVVEAALEEQLEVFNKQIIDLQMGFANITADMIADHALELKEAIESRDAIIAMRDDVIDAKNVRIEKLKERRDTLKGQRDRARTKRDEYKAEVADLETKLTAALDNSADEAEIARLTAELETAVSDALFVGNVVVDGVRIGEGGIAASLGYEGRAVTFSHRGFQHDFFIEGVDGTVVVDHNGTEWVESGYFPSPYGAQLAALLNEKGIAPLPNNYSGTYSNGELDGLAIKDIASLIQHAEDISYNVENVAYSLLDAGLYGTIEEATAAILDGSAQWAVGAALIQATLDGFNNHIGTARANALANATDSAATVTDINLQALFGTAQRIYVTKNDGHSYGVDIAGSYDAELSSTPDADSVADIQANGTANIINSLRVDDQTIVVTNNFFSLNSLVERVADESFAVGFERGFSEGYDKGFRDGFEAGYNEGYNDGFADGVASVQ